MTDDAIVGWRYKCLGFKWTNQKHEPTFLRGREDVELEPMYSAAEITRLRAELAAMTAERDAPLTPAEAMARCHHVRTLVDSARRVHANLKEGDFISATRLDELQAALATFTKDRTDDY